MKLRHLCGGWSLRASSICFKCSLDIRILFFARPQFACTFCSFHPISNGSSELFEVIVISLIIIARVRIPSAMLSRNNPPPNFVQCIRFSALQLGLIGCEHFSSVLRKLFMQDSNFSDPLFPHILVRSLISLMSPCSGSVSTEVIPTEAS